MKDNSDSQFFYKILNGINSNIRIIDVEANKSVYMNECCKKTFQVEHPEGKLCWETQKQLGVLKEMCCDVIQGYFLNKPLSEEEFEKQYFRKNRRQ